MFDEFLKKNKHTVVKEEPFKFHKDDKRQGMIICNKHYYYMILNLCIARTELFQFTSDNIQVTVNEYINNVFSINVVILGQSHSSTREEKLSSV